MKNYLLPLFLLLSPTAECGFKFWQKEKTPHKPPHESFYKKYRPEIIFATCISCIFIAVGVASKLGCFSQEEKENEEVETPTHDSLVNRLRNLNLNNNTGYETEDEQEFKEVTPELEINVSRPVISSNLKDSSQNFSDAELELQYDAYLNQAEGAHTEKQYNAFMNICSVGKLYLVKYCYKIGYDYFCEESLKKSIKSGNLELVRFFIEEIRFPISEINIEELAEEGISDEIISYLRDVRRGLDENAKPYNKNSLSGTFAGLKKQPIKSPIGIMQSQTSVAIDDLQQDAEDEINFTEVDLGILQSRTSEAADALLKLVEGADPSTDHLNYL